MKIYNMAIALTVLTTLGGLTACNNIMPSDSVTVPHKTPTATAHEAPMPDATTSMNVVQVAQSSPDFSILVQAISQAGLVEALSNPDANYTIFAPTNEAFAALLQETGLTKEELVSNKALLQKVLAYHVVNGAAPIYAKDVKAGEVMTLAQQNFTVTPQSTLIDGKGRTANIIKTDLAASNGVIHVIDRVLLP